MSRRKADVFSEVVVGAFMLAVLALLVYFTIIISGVDVLQGRRKVVANVTFEQVGGLKAHDNVMYRGTKVGGVERIALSPTNVVVSIEIDRAVVLREGCRIAVCNLSMLGGNYLLLEEGEGEVVDLETHPFVGETPSDWMRDVSKIARNLKEFTGDGALRTIVTNVVEASEKVRTVTARVERGEGTLGKLLSPDDTLYGEVRGIVTNLAASGEKVRDVAERVARGEGTVGRLLSTNDTVYADLRRAVASAAEVAGRLERGDGVAGALLSTNDTLFADVKGAVASFRKACDGMDFGAAVGSASNLLTNLNAVATRLKNGEGSLGRLVGSDEMYREVDGAIRDVRQVLDNYRDTTPISTFGSLIMGGL